MKPIFAVLTFACLVTNASAATAIKPCTELGMKYLLESIADWKKDGYVNVKMIKNFKNETLGFYSWDVKAEQIYVDVCENLDSVSETVASDWYYWEGEEGRANPKSWKAHGVYMLAQDEGKAYFTVIKTSSKGDVTVKMEIEGVDENIVRSEVVKFANP